MRSGMKAIGWGALAAAMLVAAPASAKQWTVAMVNRGPAGAMDYTPSFLKIAPGDSVRFVPQDKGHNAEAIATLLPAGAPAFKGKINEEIVVVFKAPGLYGYKCLPHFGMGMVGAIQVGAAGNRTAFAEAVQKLPPLARARMTAILKQVR